MTIGRDNTDQRIDRLRRETSGETDATVVGYLEEGSGAVTALKGREDQGGPYVQPVGERPLRGDRYSLYTDLTLSVEVAFDFDLSVFPSLDVREWRTASFQFIYQPGFRGIGQPPEVTILQYGRLVWRLDGSLNSTPEFYPEGVLDGSLFYIGSFTERMRQVDAAAFITPAVAVDTFSGSALVWEVAYDVDPYDFIRLPVCEYDPTGTSPPSTVLTPGSLTVYARRVR